MLLVAQIALAWFLSSRIQQFSVNTARLLFICYAIITGVVFSAILLQYGFALALTAFGMASVYFGCMVVLGLITKRDVSGFKPLIIAGLVTMLILQIIAIIFSFGTLDTILCYVGIGLFMGITAYDSKKVKDCYFSFKGDEKMLKKISIFSALALYLDFVNLFLYLIRLLGKRR